MSKKAKEYTSLLEAMNDGFCMILEVYNDKKGIHLNESQANVPEGMMRVTGIAAKIGVKNRNGRIYNRENYKKHIIELQKLIPGGLYGELEHPDGFTINNNNISHKIEAVWYDEATNEIKITLLLLDTPKGKIAQSIIKSGGSLKVSSRARGFVNKSSEAIIEELITYDIVGTPGFAETELYLSESYQKVNSDMLCESYVVYNKPIQNISESKTNFNNIQMKNQQKNQALLESALNKGKKPERVNESSVDKKFLFGEYANEIQKWMIESFAPIVQNWVIEDFAPLYESYQKRKALNESRGKTSISFPVFASMSIAETKRLNESQQEPENGTVVLTQEEQQALQKMQEGQQLENGEIVLAEKAITKLSQQQQKQQQKQKQQMSQQQEPQNGQVVLTQQEKDAVQKLQEGQTLDADDLKIIESATKKLSQQQQTPEQKEMNQQQEQQTKDELKESLNNKIGNINKSLKSKYKSLMESQDVEDQKQINQEITDLQDELTEAQQKLDDLDEDGDQQKSEEEKLQEQQEKDQQEQKFQQAMKIVKDGQELKDEDIEGLTQTQVQQILDASKTNESQIPADDADRKVLDENEELPTQEEEKQIKESLIEKKGANLINKSASLLESIQERMNNTGIGGKKK